MKTKLMKLNKTRQRRTMSVRKKLRGTPVRPRLCVVKTNCHIHVQLIDDENHVTLAAISTNSKEMKAHNSKNKDNAKLLGTRIAEMAAEKNIKEALFDRGRSKYHGVLAALADAARETGLKI